MKNKTTITISNDTAKKLRMTKIESDAKDMDQVVRDLIDRQHNPQITLNSKHVNVINDDRKIDWKKLKELVKLDDGESNGKSI